MTKTFTWLILAIIVFCTAFTFKSLLWNFLVGILAGVFFAQAHIQWKHYKWRNGK